MGRKIFGVIATILAVILVVWLVGPKEEDRVWPNWDVNSTRPEGAKGMAMLLAELDMPLSVTFTLPKGADKPPVLILHDYYNDKQTEQLLDYVKAGGTVIQAASDQLERLEWEDSVDVPRSRLLNKDCSWPELVDVDGVRVEATDVLTIPAKARINHDAQGCFNFQEQYWLVKEHIGDGVIYTINDGQAFTNQLLEADDNAVLLVRLLESSGKKPSRVLRFKPLGIDEIAPPALITLVPNAAWFVFFHLIVVLAFFAYQQAIRPNRVVRETMMTPLPASSAASAFGHYLWASAKINAVGRMARQDAIAGMARLIHVDTGDKTVFIAALARATGRSPDALHQTLYGDLPTTRQDLFALLIELSTLLTILRTGRPTAHV